MNCTDMEEWGHSMTESKKQSWNLPPDGAEHHKKKPDKIPGLSAKIWTQDFMHIMQAT